MEEENQQNELEALSRAWSERIKGIRDSVRQKGFETQPDEPEESVSLSHDEQVPDDNELFTPGVLDSQGSIYEQNPAPAINYNASLATKNTTGPKISLFSPSYIKFLVAGCLIIALGLTAYGLFSKMIMSQQLTPASASAADTLKTPDTLTNPEYQLRDIPEPKVEHTGPVSIKIAQDYYEQAQYDHALAVYDRLIENLDQEAKNNGQDAFLSYKKALCYIAQDETEKAMLSLKGLAQHRLPVIRALSNYLLCLEEYNQRQYLSARTYAYRALALMDAAGDSQPFSELRRNSQYLAAESLTRHVLMLLEGDSDLPTNTWGTFSQTDLNQMTNEQKLIPYLTAGAKELSKATLRPVVEVQLSDSQKYWTVTTKGASLDEILTRFSANGDFSFEQQTQPPLLNCPIYMFLKNNTGQQALTTSAGCAGLIADFHDNNNVTIFDPVESSFTREQIMRLCDEAVGCWQQFLFTYYDDINLPNVYFLLGVLKAEQGQTAEALGHYKMVANRFYQSEIAPSALLFSASLKLSLNDFSGAYEVLDEAVHQYPNYEKVDTACLMLADAALKMDQKDEAASLYSKVYFINNSVQTRAAAALKAGQVHYQNNEYEQAQKWLARYLELAPDTSDSQYYQACLFLGLTWQALDNIKAACDTLEMSLSDKLSQDDYLHALSAFVECSMKRGSYIAALNILNDASSRPFSQSQSVTLLLLRSRTLCSMGLTEQAIMLLNDRFEYLIDDTLKAKVGYEISDCYIQQGDYQSAREILMKMLDYTGADLLAQQTMLKLANVCVELSQDKQVIGLCTKLLEMNPDESLESQVRALLAKTYRKQKNYEHAALSMLGQVQ